MSFIIPVDFPLPRFQTHVFLPREPQSHVYLPRNTVYDEARERVVVEQIGRDIHQLQDNPSIWAELYPTMNLVGEWFMMQLDNEESARQPEMWERYKHYRDFMYRRAARSINVKEVSQAIEEFNSVATKYYRRKMDEMFVQSPRAAAPDTQGAKRKPLGAPVLDSEFLRVRDCKVTFKKAKCVAACSAGMLQPSQ